MPLLLAPAEGLYLAFGPVFTYVRTTVYYVHLIFFTFPNYFLKVIIYHLLKVLKIGKNQCAVLRWLPVPVPGDFRFCHRNTPRTALIPKWYNMSLQDHWGPGLQASNRQTGSLSILFIQILQKCVSVQQELIQNNYSALDGC